MAKVHDPSRKADAASEVSDAGGHDARLRAVGYAIHQAHQKKA
jgi:hypothetical protein